MSKEMLRALAAIEEEKGVKQEIVIKAMKKSLEAAYKRFYGQAQNVKVDFNEKKGDFKVFQEKEVVEDVFDSQLEISLKDALAINAHYELGDKIKFEQTPKDFGRIAAQTAKQVIMQTVREEERNLIYNEFVEHEEDVMMGTVERKDNRFVYVKLGKIEAIMKPDDLIRGEKYNPHDRIKVYLVSVNKTTKGPQINVSRTHPNFLRRLFEAEVPEIYDGLVEIKSIAREAGDRAKISVCSKDGNIDPVGTVVGQRGARVQAVVNELSGENMDVVKYSEDPATYITNALNPAQVIKVLEEPGKDRSVTVIVPDSQLSLAIGKRGQNARLAAHLTGYKIDIKPESDLENVLARMEKCDRISSEIIEEKESTPSLDALEKEVTKSIDAKEELEREETAVDEVVD